MALPEEAGALSFGFLRPGELIRYYPTVQRVAIPGLSILTAARVAERTLLAAGANRIVVRNLDFMTAGPAFDVPVVVEQMDLRGDGSIILAGRDPQAGYS